MSICVFDETTVQKIHDKYYKYPIINKNGKKQIEYDANSLELLNVSNFNFIVHKNDTCIADSLRSGELFEKFIVTFVRHFINPNKNIIDLGANIGTHSIIYANYTNGNVYSFEPQKTVFDILNKNVELNNCKNIITHNFGGSSINKKFYMNACYLNKDNQGAFRIDETLDSTNGLEIECKIIDELNIENVCYIKIDVEGHEYETLLGLKKTLIKEHPTLMIEIHNSCSTRHLTFKFLEELGYKNHYRFSHCDYLFLFNK
jgi:FkbM family methyltransferase